MVIQTSSVAMRSDYFYSRTSAETVSYTGWGGAVESAGGTAATTPSATDSGQKADMVKADSGDGGQTAWHTGLQGGTGRVFLPARGDAYFREGNAEYEGLRHILMILSGRRDIRMRRVSAQDVLEKLKEQQRELLEELGLAAGGPETAAAWQTVQSGLTPTQSFQGTLSVQHYREERESSSFYSSGTVRTADGRTIEFDIEAEMSRSFAEHSAVEIDFGAVRLMDPLVINLDGGTAEVSDQKFFFDIDCDGELDNISLLAKGCGFLALDRNGDGRIDDGSELFGAKSGDGFGELAVFDLDGNGWLDGNDEVFNRLRIWTKDESGNDRLVALGAAGIGAIYLGHAATRFSLNSAEDNETNAVVRSSGIYLNEDGSAGILQQIDLAVG